MKIAQLFCSCVEEAARVRMEGLSEEILDEDLPDSYDKDFFEMKTNLLMTHFMDMAIKGYGWVTV